MSYVSLYRKYRPQTFDEIVGQIHVTRTLSNAVKENRFSHAYLFTGPRGTGKTTTARILAKALNCAEGPTPTPCNKCSVCLGISNGSCVDILEIDAASNRGIDEIRDLREKINFLPIEGRFKVYIIDEVHMLTAEAFNALLKTLEEPPVHVVFVLATTEPHKVLPTILSRCQRFDFRRLTVLDMAKTLKEIAEKEKITIDKTALPTIARHAQGSLRDAISLLDQLSSFTGKNVTSADLTALLGTVDVEKIFKIAEIITEKDTASAFYFVEDLVASGWDMRQFTKELISFFRDLLVIKNTGNSELINAGLELISRFEAKADCFEAFELMRFIEILSQSYNEMRWGTDARLILELALVKMTKLETDISLEGLLRRIEELEGMPARREFKAQEEKAGKAKEKKESKPEKKVKEEIKEEEIGYSVLDIEKAKRAWPVVVRRVKDKKISTHSLLLGCQPDEIKDGTLILKFKSEAEFHLREMEKSKNLDILRQALKEVFGFELKIACVLEELKEQTEEKLKPVFGKQDDDSDLVSLAKDSFGAEIVDEVEFP